MSDIVLGVKKWNLESHDSIITKINLMFIF
jgi:hypothetical protein